ncbi:MAG: YfkD family protein [Bacillaceae bacterium]
MYATNAQGSLKIPRHVIDISKENTYPNPTQDLPKLEPSKFAKTLLKTSDIGIENPRLIKLFNESSASSGSFSVGYKAVIYLGRWPLRYESTETAVNWEYKKVNANYYDNKHGRVSYGLRYNQNEQAYIRGGLTSKVSNEEDVKKMVLSEAMEKTGLPLAFTTIIGYGTKKDYPYNIAPKTIGHLYAYAPAVNEKGKVTFGEVYIVLKGNQKKLMIKNVTSHGIGAWIPVQDRIALILHN